MEEKIFWKRYVFSLEWKSEGVMDDDSGDSEDDEGEEDWLRQGWSSEAGSLFQCCAAMICNQFADYKIKSGQICLYFARLKAKMLSA